MDNIDVVVRVRPLIKREVTSDQTSLWANDKLHISSKDKEFTFDRIFGPQDDNSLIYTEIGRPIVEKVMQGINGTLFAYGQTASGKTHTIMGESAELGVVPLAVKDIFSHINNSPSREFLLRASYMEIYNEEIHDLLDVKAEGVIKLRTTQNNEVAIDNLSEHSITSYEDVMLLLRQGTGSRKVAATNMNERSSRSHCIFRLAIESRALSGDANISESMDEGAVIVSQLNLVDLAGSERASQTGAQGVRLKESNHINTSLMTLGLVIRKLSNEVERNSYIPYRDSKLTRILQHSLGGNAKTSIIATVSPVSLEETTQTLMFAERAKNVANKPVVNEIVDGDTELKRQKREIAVLKKKISELESAPSVNDNVDTDTQRKRMAHLLKQIICSGPKRDPKQFLQKAVSKRRQTCCPGEFRMRDEDKNMSTIMDDFDFDDTTHCFEKWEKKLQDEDNVEMATEVAVPDKEVEALKRNLEEKDNEIGGLLKIIKDLQDQVRDVSSKDREVEELQKVIKDLQKGSSDVGTLNDVIESLGIENQTLQEGLDGAMAQNALLNQQIEQLQSDITSSQKETENSKKKVTELLGEVSNLAAVKENLLDEFENNKNKFMSSVGNLGTEMDDARARLTEKDVEILNLQEETLMKDSEIASKDSRISLMISEIEEYRIKLDKESSTNDKMNIIQEENQQLQSKLSELSVLTNGQNSEIAILKMENQSSVTEMENLRQTIDEKCKEKSALAQQLVEMKAELQKSSEEKNQTDVLVVKLNELNSELTTVKTENGSFLQEIENLRCNIDKKDEEKISLVKQLDDLNVELQRNIEENDQNEVLVAQLNELKGENQSFLQEIENLRHVQEENGEEKAVLLKQLEDLNVELQKNLEENSQNGELFLQLNEHKSKLSSLQAENNDFLQEIDNLRHTMEKQEEEKSSLVKQLDDMNLELQRSMEENDQNMVIVTQLNELNNELDTLRAEKQGFVQEIENMRQAHEENGEEKAVLVKQMEEMKAELQKNVEENNQNGELVVQLNEHKSKLTTLQSENEGFLQEIDNLQCTIGKRDEEISSLVKQLDDLNVKLERIIEESHQNEVNTKLATLGAENQGFVLEIENLQRRLEEIGEEKSALLKQLENLNMELQRTQENQNNVEAVQSDTLNSEFTRVREENQTLLQEVASLRGTVIENGEEKSALLKQLENLNMELQRNHKENQNDVEVVRSDELNTEFTRMREENQTLLLEVENLRGTVIEKEEEKSILLKRLENLNMELKRDHQESQNDVEVVQSDKLNTEFTRMREENQTLLQEVENLRCTIIENGEEKSALVKQLEDMNIELQRNLGGNDQDGILAVQLNELNSELTAVRAENEVLVREMENLRCIIAEDGGEKSSLVKQIEGLSAELEGKLKDNDHDQEMQLNELNSALTTLRAKNLALVQEIENLQCTVSKNGDEKFSLEKQLEDVNKELQRNVENNQNDVNVMISDELSSKLTTLEAANSDLLQEIENLRHIIGEKDEEKSWLVRQLDDVKAGNLEENDQTEHMMQLNELQSELATLRAENKGLAEDIDNLRGSLNEHNLEKSERVKLLEEKNVELQRNLEQNGPSDVHVLQLNELSHQLATLRAENQGLVNKIECLQRTINEKSDEKSSSIKQLVSDTDIHDTAESDVNGLLLSELNNELLTVKTENQQLVQEITDLRLTINVNKREDSESFQIDDANVQMQTIDEGHDQTELHVLQEKISKISMEMDSLLNELNIAKEKYERAEQESKTLKSLNEDLLHNNDQLENCAAGLREAMLTKDEKLQELKECINNLREEEMRLQHMIQEQNNAEYCEGLEAKVGDLEEENKYLKEKANECIELISRIENFNRDLEALRSEKEVIMNEMSEMRNTLTITSGEKEELQNEMRNMYVQVQSLQEKDTIKQREYDDLADRISQVQEHNDSLNDKLNDIEKSYEEANSEVSKLQSVCNQISEEKTDLESTVIDLKAKLAETDKLLLEKEDCVVELQKENDANEKVVQSFQDTVDQLNTKCASVEENLAQKSSEVERLQSCVNKQKEDISAYVNRLREQKLSIDKLNKQIEVYQEQNTKLGKDMMEMNNPRQSNDVKDLKRKNIELENDNFTLKEDLRNLQKTYESLKESEFALTCCRKKLEERNATLLEDIDASKKAIEDEKMTSKKHLEMLSEKMKAKYEKQQSDLRAEMKRLGDGLTTAYEKYKSYKALYLETNDECEKYRTMLEEVSLCVKGGGERNPKRTRSQCSSETSDSDAAAKKKAVVEKFEERSSAATEKENGTKELSNKKTNLSTSTTDTTNGPPDPSDPNCKVQ